MKNSFWDEIPCRLGRASEPIWQRLIFVLILSSRGLAYFLFDSGHSHRTVEEEREQPEQVLSEMVTKMLIASQELAIKGNSSQDIKISMGPLDPYRPA